MNKSELESHLIGEWESYAFSCKYCQTQSEEIPRMKYQFFEDYTGHYKSNISNVEHEFVWSVMDLATPNEPSQLKLDIEPDDQIEDFDFFCPNFIIFDANDVINIYKKQ